MHMDDIKTVPHDRLAEGYSPDADCNGLEGSTGDCSEDEEYAARRLTPTECARLQGFPPDWCADVPHTDSNEYKLWGNGISLPCLIPMMKSMHDILEKELRET